MKLNELGEDLVVRELTKSIRVDSRVKLGVGDDCALVECQAGWQLLKTDCLIEGVHFVSDADPKWVGWKALCRVISDIAAMGGRPGDALITLAVPAEMAWLKRLYLGLRAAASEYGINLVGGETARSPGPIFISVALTGFLVDGKYVTRSGGRLGDNVYVTGKLGGSIRGRHLRFRPRIKEASWLIGHFPIHAMMDLSDGLASDLPRLAAASKLGFRIDLASIPLSTKCTVENGLRDGEDYELLFAAPAALYDRLMAEWKIKFPQLRLTAIGQLLKNEKSELIGKGYDHFSGGKEKR
jgi:thiamine-monophosphate kinase